MNRTVVVGGAAVVMTAALWSQVAGAQTGTAGPTGATAWVHVRVEEAARSSRVSVNLPMPVVAAALKAAPETIAADGRIKLCLSRHSLSLADMRKAWEELKAAGDTELVSVEEKDETVKVARRGDLVQVRVNNPGQKEEVSVDLPVGVVDAALAGDGDTIDVKGLVQELQKRRGDIVRVNDKDSNVRVWIDETAAGASPAGR
jgi:hypothetical protein